MRFPHRIVWRIAGLQRRVRAYADAGRAAS
jgi:hypothetical protein